jgi:hypothetical protein
MNVLSEQINCRVTSFKPTWQAMRKIMSADYHNISNRWNNHVSQSLNEVGVSDVGQTEIHTSEPQCLSLVPLRFRQLLKICEDIN